MSEAADRTCQRLQPHTPGARARAGSSTHRGRHARSGAHARAAPGDGDACCPQAARGAAAGWKFGRRPLGAPQPRTPGTLGRTRRVLLLCALHSGGGTTPPRSPRGAVAPPSSACQSPSVRPIHVQAPVPLELRSFGHGAAGWGGPHLAQWVAYARQRGYCRLPILDGVDQLLLRIEAAAGAPGPQCFCHFDLLPDNFVLHAASGAVHPPASTWRPPT